MLETNSVLQLARSVTHSIPCEQRRINKYVISCCTEMSGTTATKLMTFLKKLAVASPAPAMGIRHACLNNVLVLRTIYQQNDVVSMQIVSELRFVHALRSGHMRAPSHSSLRHVEADPVLAAHTLCHSLGYVGDDRCIFAELVDDSRQVVVLHTMFHASNAELRNFRSPPIKCNKAFC